MLVTVEWRDDDACVIYALSISGETETDVDDANQSIAVKCCKVNQWIRL